MNVESNSLFRSFQSAIGSYQDVSAIYTKLFSQGQLQKLTGLVSDIYDEEHVFTLTELQKYCQENNQKEDNFVAEQYELNANIFRRNLTLIVNTIVDELGKKSIERFRQDYGTGSSSDEVSFKQVQNNEQSSQEFSSEKNAYKSNMPEIQEEAEGNSRSVTNKPTPKAVGPNGENVIINKNFDLNMNDLAQKVQPQQEENLKQNPREATSYQMPRAKSYERIEVKTHQRSSAANGEKEDNLKQTSPYYRSETSGFAASEPTRADEFSQYDHESGTFRVSQQAKQSINPHARNSQNSTHWSSSERNTPVPRRGNPSPTHPKNMKAFSPERPSVYDRASPLGLSNSFSRWSSTNGRPDPTILDSEFSYGQGNSFSKSPKKFHHDIKNIPGPGDYEVDDALQATRNKSPDLSFSKSPKTPSYFQTSKVPGAIYYPTKHFLSK